MYDALLEAEAQKQEYRVVTRRKLSTGWCLECRIAGDPLGDPLGVDWYLVRDDVSVYIDNETATAICLMKR